MAKKLIIPFNIDNDFIIIGIASNMEDFRVAYFINKSLNLELKKEIDFLFYDLKAKMEIAYSFYEFADEVNFVNYLLIENKKNATSLIKYWKIYDYFLIISGTVAKFNYKEILKIISKIHNIKIAKELLISFTGTLIKSSKLHNEVNNLMSGIELHKIEINSNK